MEFVQTASLQECVARMSRQAPFVKSAQTATCAYGRAPSVERELPLEGARLCSMAWPENLAVVCQLAEERAATARDRANGGAPDVCEHEALDPRPPRRALHRDGIEMSADATAELDRSVPRRGFREH